MAIRIIPKERRAAPPLSGDPVDNAPQDKETKQQATRKLPTDRIAFQKQMDILRALGHLSQGGTRAVPMREAAEFVKMSVTTLPLMSAFIVDSGIVEKSGVDFVPHRALIEFAQAHSWNPESAPRKLAPMFRHTWFGNRLVTRLGFSSMANDEAVEDLGLQIAAPPDAKPQVQTLIEFLIVCGLVRRDGTQLSLGPQASGEGTEAPQAQKEKPVASDAQEVRAEVSARPPGAIATGFMSTEGGVQFHVAIKVDMKEMAGWAPDRIAAFFSGIAQVLAAKKGTEEV
jgi:DNA-binding IclR family transcriptional regulator